MQVLSLPSGLKTAILSLALGVPLCALETVLLRHAPWWRMPYSRIALACLPALLIYCIIAGLLRKGMRAGFYLAVLTGVTWVCITGWLAIRTHNPSVAFLAVLLAGLWTGVLTWIHIELGRSYFDPEMRWYEGLPKPVPGLTCEVLDKEQKVAYRVARLDRKGVFIFLNHQIEPALFCSPSFLRAHELRLSFRDRQVCCPGVPVRGFLRSGQKSGMGFQFVGLSPDACKLLGDFVETLKGEGYV